MDRALIYCYRNWYSFTAYNDQNNPVVASIATFRAFDMTTPVYVLDSTEHEIDWSDLPTVLNFKIIKKPHVYKTLEPSTEKNIYWQLLSKPLDIYEFTRNLPHTIFMVCDADILFFQNPWPLLSNPEQAFVCGSNTGLYYFHKYRPATTQLFETWGSLGALAIGYPHFRKKVISRGVIQEETVFRYMARCHGERLHISAISPYENFNSVFMRTQRYDLRQIKMFHLCSEFGRPNRGRAALGIAEVRQSVLQTLNKDYLRKVFDGFDCDFYSIVGMERSTFVGKVRKAIGND